MNAIFTISLDFELHWGGFEKWPLENFKEYFKKTREVIPDLINLFSDHDVHVTWATVGLLLHSHKYELLANAPELKPTYKNNTLSAYQYIEKKEVGVDEDEDPFHFANSLIKKIVDIQGQELASHSFAHFYCNEEGQTSEQFYHDAISWNKAGNKYGIIARSLVFPRNQFNDEYLKECKKAGIKIVRTNPKDWWWQINSTQNESKWKRLNRGVDAYFSIGDTSSYPLNQIKKNQGIYLMPASRLLRPYNPREYFLNSKKINRIKKEMTHAAKNNECYHLWWHPHNFGYYPYENMQGLKSVLQHYNALSRKFHMKSLNMGEVAELLDNV